MEHQNTLAQLSRILNQFDSLSNLVSEMKSQITELEAMRTDDIICTDKDVIKLTGVCSKVAHRYMDAAGCSKIDGKRFLSYKQLKTYLLSKSLVSEAEIKNIVKTKLKAMNVSKMSKTG